MIKKVPVSALRLGMYVTSIDCRWLDTPFLWHRFRLESSEQIATLRQCCRNVCIDTEKSHPQSARARELEPSPAPAPNDRPSATDSIPLPAGQPVIPLPTQGEQHQLYQESLTVLNQLFDDIRLGRSLDGESAKRVVQSLAASVVSDSHAMIYLTQLKEKGGDLAKKSVNVCILTLVFAKHLGIAKRKLHTLGLGALLHDIGMLQIPNNMLCKCQALLPPERCLMQKHTDFGVQILANAEGIDKDILDIVRYHHERIDGNGYPAQLKERQTRLFPRIVAITSVYEALTRERGYKKALSPTQALKNIYQGRNTDFDGRLVEKFIQALGIYPVGCLVETGAGDIARVVAVCEQQRHRPILELMLDKQSQRLDNIRVDLSEEQHQQITIKKAVEPQDPRVDQLLDVLLAAYQQPGVEPETIRKG